MEAEGSRVRAYFRVCVVYEQTSICHRLAAATTGHTALAVAGASEDRQRNDFRGAAAQLMRKSFIAPPPPLPAAADAEFSALRRLLLRFVDDALAADAEEAARE